MIHETPIDADATLYIASHMREWDRREIFATMWSDSPLALADRTLAAAAVPGAWARTIWVDRAPCAVLGVTPMWPGVAGVWCFATDSFGRIGQRLTRRLKRNIIPALAVELGLHRAECRSIEGHDEAHRWLECLGARREGEPLRDFGKGRETFFTYAWRLSDLEAKELSNVSPVSP